MTKGIAKYEYIDGKQYLTNKPPCGAQIRVNGSTEVVTMLTTHYCISPIPKPKVGVMIEGDEWEIVEDNNEY